MSDTFIRPQDVSRYFLEAFVPLQKKVLLSPWELL